MSMPSKPRVRQSFKLGTTQGVPEELVQGQRRQLLLVNVTVMRISGEAADPLRLPQRAVAATEVRSPNLP